MNLTIKNTKKYIYEYPTFHQFGFTRHELAELCTENKFNVDVFYTAMGINSCMNIGGETVFHHCDILKAVNALLIIRERNLAELNQ